MLLHTEMRRCCDVCDDMFVAEDDISLEMDEACLLLFGQVLRDFPRPAGFGLIGVRLRGAWFRLGLPQGGQYWSNNKILSHFFATKTNSMHRKCALAMGLHDR